MNWLYMYIRQVTEQTKYLQKPDDYDNYNYYIEDSFKRALHRDITIYNPQENTGHNNYK